MKNNQVIDEESIAKKRKMTNRILVLIFVLIVGSFAVIFFGDDVSRKYPSAFLPINNVYEVATYKDIKKLSASDEKFIVYFSKTTCSSCQSNIGPINSLAKKNGVKKIYILDAAGDDAKTFASNFGLNKGITPQLMLIKGSTILAQSCSNTVKVNDQTICEFFDGTEMSRKGIIAAAEYIFELYKN